MGRRCDLIIPPEIAHDLEEVAANIREANAALIVDAVNERERLRVELACKTRNYDDVIAYHQRTEESLRDIVRRLCDLFTSGTIHPAGTMERLLREARAAIGEDAK